MFECGGAVQASRAIQTKVTCFGFSQAMERGNQTISVHFAACLGEHIKYEDGFVLTHDSLHCRIWATSTRSPFTPAMTRLKLSKVPNAAAP